MLGKFLAFNTVYCASAGKVGIPSNPDPTTYSPIMAQSSSGSKAVNFSIVKIPAT
jgi:hypothetical protein